MQKFNLSVVSFQVLRREAAPRLDGLWTRKRVSSRPSSLVMLSCRFALKKNPLVKTAQYSIEGGHYEKKTYPFCRQVLVDARELQGEENRDIL